jgi:uncharacterized membrane protein YdjX (TVP38/TMEM64 family)
MAMDRESNNKGSRATEASSETSSGRSGLWRPLILITGIGLVIVLARVFEADQYLGSLRDWIDGLGSWGPVVFILIYAVAVVAAIPGVALTVIAGALFGSAIGIVVVSIAATLGASLAFLVARYFARDATARWLSKKETFRRLDEMTETHGATIVALTRLVPIFPFNLLNYGFGLTRVPFWTYVFWSWLCMLPGTVLYVVGADAVTKAVTQGDVPWGLVLGVAVAALVLTVLVRFARAKLQST